jgi:prevent-host-death family protein
MDSPRTLSAAEARAHFSEIVTEAGYAGRDTIIERNNRPVAVVIGYAEYQALQALRDDARKARFAVLDEIRSRNADADPEQVERDIAEAIRAVRQSKQ